LKNFKNLWVLNLSGTTVTDAGLMELKDLKNLGELFLKGTQVTDAGVKAIREAMSKSTKSKPMIRR
jgi:hypothetical protein